MVSIRVYSVASAWLGALGFFLALLGAKLWLIQNYGVASPFGDDWDIQGDLYGHYVNGPLDPALLFAPHNEHRLVLTRLTSLAFLELSGDWDVKLQMVANAVLHSAVIALVLVALRPALGAIGWIACVLVAALLFGLPFGWENTLWASQSQIYFLVGLSLLALFLTTTRTPLSPFWFVGALAGAASTLAMASGLLVLPVMIGFHGVQAKLARERRRAHLIAAALALILGAALSGLMVHASADDPMRAHSIAQFADSMTRILEWPIRSSPLDAIALWHPCIFLTALLIVRRAPDDDRAWFIVAGAGWVLAQCAAMAYARTGGSIASRHMDILVLGLVFNVACALIILDRLKAWKRRRLYAIMLAVIAVAGAIGTETRAAKTFPAQLDQRHEEGLRHEARLQRYLAHGDATALVGTFPEDIPFPRPEGFKGVLDRPFYRGLLPAELGAQSADREATRAHLALHGAVAPTADAFKRVALAIGAVLAAFGVLLLAIAMAFALRRKDAQPTGA